MASSSYAPANGHRPVIRVKPGVDHWSKWTIAGATTPASSSAEVVSSGNCLTLEGLFLSGADLVLTGDFDCVTLTCCTLDPGKVAQPGTSPPYQVFDLSADQRELVPSRLWVEGTVTTMTVDRSILASIRTRNGGQIETLTITNSILQAIPSASPSLPIEARDVKDPVGLEQRLAGSNPVSV